MLKKKATETADSEKSEWFFWFRKHNFKNQAIRASWEKASFLTVGDEEKKHFPVDNSGSWGHFAH